MLEKHCGIKILNKKKIQNSTVFNLWFELSLDTKGTSSNQFETLNYIVDI